MRMQQPPRPMVVSRARYGGAGAVGTQYGPWYVYCRECRWSLVMNRVWRDNSHAAAMSVAAQHCRTVES